jgi:photosystem II stability/assembly factor-like uncharacterized protein
MKLCVGTSKGVVILDPARGATPLMVLADPSPVWCMTQDCADPNLLYAGVNDPRHGRAALARSLDGGRTWKDIAPPAVREEEVWAIAAAPEVKNFLLIGTSHGRLFRSDDAGRNFFEFSAFLDLPGRHRWTFPMPPHVPHVRSIAFEPGNPSVVYVGVEEGGVFRSRDRGESFEALNSGLCADVHSVGVDPASPRRLYAATGRGIYVSDSAGATWRHAPTPTARTYTVPLLVLDGAYPVVYTAAAAGPPPAWSTAPRGADAVILRSVDRGKTFAAVDGGLAPRRGMVMRLRRGSDASGCIFGVATDGTVFQLGSDAEAPLVIAERLPPAHDFAILP